MASNLLNHTLQIRWQRHAIDLADLGKPKLDHRAGECRNAFSSPWELPGARVDMEERDPQSLLLGVLRAQRRVQLLSSRQALLGPFASNSASRRRASLCRRLKSLRSVSAT